MSLRPPATFWERHTTVPSTIATSRPGNGGTLHLQGIIFETAGDFAATPAEFPSGVASSVVTIPVNTGFYELVPASIDAATTAIPFVLVYGPLGPGAL